MRQLLLLTVFFVVPNILSAQNAWINEFHYDDEGGDANEFIEVIVENASSYTLSDFTVQLYNGNNGSSYGDHTLDSFTASATSGNFTVYYKLIAGIQNGAPDGIALGYQNALIAGQFLSYEGSFVASGGIADGVTSVDIGVSETSATTDSESLQLTGIGTSYSDFTWSGPAAASAGDVNAGQTLGGVTEPTTPSSNITSTTFGTRVRIQFTRGDGNAHLILIKQGAAVDADPVDGSTYSAQYGFGAGEELGSGNFVVSNGSESVIEVYNLQPQTTYHIEIFEVNGDDYLTSASAIADFTTGEITIANNFENGFRDWFFYNAASNADWQIRDDGGAESTTNYAYMSGFGADAASDDWLISPVINFDNLAQPLLEFYWQYAFNDVSFGLDLKYSTDYSGSGDPSVANWISLDVETDPGLPASDNTWTSVSKDLSTLTGNAYLAFHYTSSGTGGGETRNWSIDEISIVELGVSEPTSAISGLTSSDVNTVSARVSWNSNAAEATLVIAKAGASTDALPADQTSYLSDANFGSGDEIGSGNFVVYSGSDTSFVLTGLMLNSEYTITAFPYNGPKSAEDYLTANAPSNSFTTASSVEVPSVNVTNLSVDFAGTNSASISWTAGDGNGRLILARAGSDLDVSPADQSYSADASFGSGDEIGSGNFVVYRGSGTGFTMNNLQIGETYYLAAFEYNDEGGTVRHLTSAASTTSFTTSETAPAAVDLFFSEYVEGSSNNKALEIFNGTGEAVDLSNYRITGKNNGNEDMETFTWADGTTLSNGEVFVLADASASPAITALADATLERVSLATATSFNGNDYRVLEKTLDGGSNWIAIDYIGEPDRVPGSAWDVAGVVEATNEQTLVRKSSVYVGNTNWSAAAGTNSGNSEWIVNTRDEIGNLGQHSFDADAVSNPHNFQVISLNLETGFNISWSKNPSNHPVVVLVSTDGSVPELSDGTALQVDDVVGNATVLYKGLDNQYDHSGLAPGTFFTYSIYSVSPANEYSSGLSQTVRTVKGIPGDHVANLMASVAGVSIIVEWDDVTADPVPDGYVVKAAPEGESIDIPTDGVPELEGSLTRIVNPGAESASFSLLQPLTTYTIRVYPFTNEATDVRYLYFDVPGGAEVPEVQATTTDETPFEVIGGTLTGPQLIDVLQDDFDVVQALGYDGARSRMYGELDEREDGRVYCVYTGFSQEARFTTFLDPINAEHTWPQSFGADSDPMRSDLHHLFPTLGNVNSARGNLPLGEVDDNQTDSWWYKDPVGSSYFVSTPPSLDVRDLYSELLDNSRFEPREDHKGDAARAIFYFWTMYQDVNAVAQNSSFFNSMKEDLWLWHYQDLPDQREIDRSTAISLTNQGNRNPFVHDTSLVRRAYFPDRSAPISGGGGTQTFTVSTNALDFGSTRVDSSKTLFVRVSNNSATESLSISNLSSNNADFPIIEPATIQIAPSSVDSIPVSFVPSGLGEIQGTVTFSNSFGASSTQIAVSGFGQNWVFDQQAEDLLFTSNGFDTLRFTVYNLGNIAMPVTAVDVSDDQGYDYEFLQNSSLPINIAPEDSLEIEVVPAYGIPLKENPLLTYMVEGILSIEIENRVTEEISFSVDVQTNIEGPNYPEKFSLRQNYPNPFNPSTTIEYELAQATEVKVDVFDVNGARVALLVNQQQAAGRYRVSFDASGLASGIYFYRLRTPEFVQVQRMTLLK